MRTLLVHDAYWFVQTPNSLANSVSLEATIAQLVKIFFAFKETPGILSRPLRPALC
jgi:hypothetical protein